MVSIQFDDDTISDVGVAIADPARSVTGAAIVAHQLVLQFDDETEVIVGRIDPTTIRALPTLNGQGVLVDAGNGTYKELKSNDPAISIVKTPSEVRFEVTLDPEQIVTPVADGSINSHLALVLKDVISSGTGSVGRAATAAGWSVRTFNEIQALSGVGASYADGQLTLSRGIWYVDGIHTSNRAGNAKAAIKDALGNIVLESLPKRHTAADVEILAYRVQGYITVTETTQTFTIEQYVSSIGTIGALGATYLGGEFGSSRPVTEYMIYRISDEPQALNMIFEEPAQPSIVNALRAMREQYKTRSATPVKVFDEIRYNDNATWNFGSSCTVGDNVYFGPGNNDDLLEWNTLTGKKVYYKAKPPSGAFFSHAMIPAENKIYIVPIDGVWIGIFDTVTKQLTWTNFGLTIPTTAAKWTCGVYDPVTKKIACPPNANVGLLLIDTTNDTATLGSYGLTYLSGNNYFSAALANGKMYALPLDATTVMVYDFATNTAIQTAMGASLSGTGKWSGTYYDPLTNKIVSTPYTATDALLIDVATETAIRTTFGLSLAGTAKFEFGSSGFGDGKVYIFPRQRANGQGICIDLVTNTGREIAIPWRDGSNYVKSALCNGKIYLLPIGSQELAVYDPATDGVVPEISGRCLITAGSSSSYRWLNAGMGGDGTFFPCPASLFEIYSVNVEEGFCVKSAWPLDIAGTTNSYIDGVRDGDGNVVMVPYGNADGLKLIAPTPGLGTLRKKHFKDHIKLVPEMTSDSQNGYVISASSFQAGFEPWKAFNGIVGSANGTAHLWASAGTDTRASPHWIQVKFPAPTRVDVVRLRSGLVTRYPTKVSIQASVDGVTFVELARRLTNFRAQYSVGKDIELDETLEFEYFRIVVLESDGAATVQFNDIQLLQRNPAEVDYYEVYAAQNSVSSTLLTITNSSSTHATNYSRHYTLRDWQYGVIDATSSWISADSSAEQWLEYRSLLPIKANALRLVNNWSYFTQSIRIEASKNGKDYVVLLPNTPVNNPIEGLGEKCQFRPIPVISFENNEEYYSYRVVFVTRTITAGAQKNAGVLMAKFLSTEPYDRHNYFGRPELMLGIYGQSSANKWRGGIYVPENGKIYFSKGDHASLVMGVYDTRLDEFTTTRFRENLSAVTTEYLASVRKNPYDESYIFGAYQSTPKVLRMRIGSNGEENIEFIPITKDFMIDTGNIGASILAPDGMCYSIPRSAPAVFHVFDMKYLSNYTEYYAGAVGGSTAFSQGGLGPNGKIYFTPFTGGTFTEFDPETMTAATIAHVVSTTAAHLAKAKLTKSGKLFLESLTGGAAFSGFFLLDFGPGITIPDEIVFSPYINN